MDTQTQTQTFACSFLCYFDSTVGTFHIYVVVTLVSSQCLTELPERRQIYEPQKTSYTGSSILYSVESAILDPLKPHIPSA